MGNEQESLDQVTIRRRGAGLIGHHEDASAGGYTLFAPLTAKGQVFLIDMEGAVVHSWKMPFPPGRHAVILPNGNLGYNGNHPDSPIRYVPWALWRGGAFLEATPDGKIVWEYTDLAHHHDAQWLENGNLLYGAVEQLPKEMAQRVIGGTSSNASEEEVIYGDVIKEVNRKGEIEWLWRSWEHLNPDDFPIHPIFARSHWPYVNGVWHTRGGLVLMSLRTTSGVIGVEKSSGKMVLHIGPEIVSQQHAPVELENGNILIFDNGNFRLGNSTQFSRIVEVNPNNKKIEWQYCDEPQVGFFSAYMGAAQRLENGNTHITESATGRLFEVTNEGEVVWEYVIPYFAEYVDEDVRKYVPGQHNSAFRSYRYTMAQIPWL